MNDYYKNLKPIFTELCSSLNTYKGIAEELNNRGYRTILGKKFTAASLIGLRRKLSINVNYKNKV